MSQAIDVTPAQREQLVSLLSTHLPNTEAWVYGSRVRWTSRPESDLDMAVFATPAQARNVYALREALEESNLPFRVDLFVWDEVPDSFREQIRREHVVLTIAKDEFHPRRARVALGDLIDLRLSSVDKKSKPNEMPVRLCNYTDVYHNAAIRRDMPFMDATASDREIAKCALSAGDVVITKDSEQYNDIGVPTYVMDDVPNLVCGYHLAILRPNVKQIDGRYLFYALSTHDVQTQFHHYANGVTRFGLRKADIGLVEIPLPCLPEQHAIAHILGTLDDKIELNRRMNETLEAMARALFKSWFVDFEPVQAKMAGGRTPFPPQITRFFPDHLTESSIGLVPHGWDVSEIGKEVMAVGGTTPSTNEPAFWTPGEHAWATPKDLSALTTPVLLDTAKKITSAGLAKISSGLLPKGTVLMSSRAPIGYLAIAETPVAVNQGFIAMVCQQQLPNLYVLFWCSENLPYIKNVAGGSTFAEISKRAFRPTPVLVPSPEVLGEFSRMVGPLYGRMVRNARQMTQLAGIRDLLLPKLVSGDIRVQQAEKAVADVL